MLGDHVPEHADPVVDAAAVLLLDEVVHLALVSLLQRFLVVVQIQGAQRRGGGGGGTEEEGHAGRGGGRARDREGGFLEGG